MSSLPSTFSPLVPDCPLSAGVQYNRVLAVEHALLAGTTNAAELVCIRVLGQCLLQTESLAGLVHLENAIRSCSRQEQLLALGKFLSKYLAKCPTPASTESPTLEEERETHIMQMETGSLSHAGAKALAMERDGARCLVSGIYSDSLELDVVQQAEVHQRLTGQETGSIHAVHIVPEVLNDLNEAALEDAQDREALRILGLGTKSTAKVLSFQRTILQIFGSQALVDELLGENMHRLENILSLASEIHHKFDLLLLWFEPTENPNEYNVCLRRTLSRPTRYIGWMTMEHVMKVTFPSTAELPAPSPHYLALHAACCRIAHLSDAADHYEKVERDLNEFKTMAAFPSHDAFEKLNIALEYGYVGRSVLEL
ncbi:hypothetical protein C8J57DRAFT_1723364 [Mycena rebaudengoi]|nr:hypothetical protein C8J57DRAFT_1723364 [Mycena rebaudengoi]